MTGSDEMIECEACGNNDEFIVFVNHVVKRKQKDNEVNAEVMAENIDIVKCNSCDHIVYVADLPEEEVEDAQNIEDAFDGETSNEA